MLSAYGTSRYSRRHTLSQPLDPTRNHLPRPANSTGCAAPNHCNNRRPRQQNGESDFLAARQLYEAFAHGGAGRDLANGSFDTSPSVPRIDRDEPASVSEAAQAAKGKGADAHGWSGCYKRGVRSRLRKCEP